MERATMAKASREFNRRAPGPIMIGLAAIAAAGVAAAAVAAIVIYAGVYNIGADVRHTKVVYWIITQLRDRSIAVRAQDLSPPPDLMSQNRITAGAGLYASNCTGCHLSPDMDGTAISQGLYPTPPQFAGKLDHSAKQEFWMIKHGVKLTAMPAWGRTHSDDQMWDLVAFVQTLPSLSPDQYQAIVKTAPKDPTAPTP
jgi:mono/diheme cytochrome c family protein